MNQPIDGFEHYLSQGLKNATAKLQEARRRVWELERDANYFEKHLALHLEEREKEDPPTQAWDPAQVAAANGSGPARTVPDRQTCTVCGDPITQRADGLLVHINGNPRCDLVHGEGTATPAQPSPPPASEPLPADQSLHPSDPTQRVDLSEAQGGAS